MPADQRYEEIDVPGLRLRHVLSDGAHTLIVSGELDLAASPALTRALDVVCRDGAEIVTLDLRNLAFMDSTGIRTVLYGQKVCAEHGCEFRLNSRLAADSAYLLRSSGCWTACRSGMMTSPGRQKRRGEHRMHLPRSRPRSGLRGRHNDGGGWVWLNQCGRERESVGRVGRRRRLEAC